MKSPNRKALALACPRHKRAGVHHVTTAQNENALVAERCKASADVVMKHWRLGFVDAQLNHWNVGVPYIWHKTDQVP
jgi:hypothetical protein